MKPSRQFLSFVAIGGAAAAVNFVVRFPINWFTSYEVAIVIAYLIAMTTAFVLNRTFVFDGAAGGAWFYQYLRFAGVNVIALVQVFLVSVGLARLLFPAIGFNWYSDAVAHFIGLASPIVTSYWGHKYFSFAGAAKKGAGA